MPTSSQSDPAEPIATSVACPQLLTPPPESDADVGAEAVPVERRVLVEDGEMDYGAPDNTAHGMAYEQEMSIYTSHDGDLPLAMVALQNEGEKEKTPGIESIETPQRDVVDGHCDPDASRDNLAERLASMSPRSPTPEGVDVLNENLAQEVQAHTLQERESGGRDSKEDTDISNQTDTSSHSEPSSPATQISDKPSQTPATILYPATPFWDFTHVGQTPHYPSSLLRPGSKFSGTQQSDRQIYNVDVDILTVDTSQSSLTGYLRICGLTEDHPTLTTFFSGEIIGGPSHKYSFRTRTPSWGATDKTDLIHWARFPAWRSMSKEAKRNIDFHYPLDGGEWWQQENVYMRWKEHFLVPDHRVRSIAGASFEGFYYATFNQVEGRISGIYFHAKSER